MQALKILGVLIMIGAVLTLIFSVNKIQTGDVQMTFSILFSYVAPVFCVGALLVGIERLMTKLETRNHAGGKSK